VIVRLQYLHFWIGNRLNRCVSLVARKKNGNDLYNSSAQAGEESTAILEQTMNSEFWTVLSSISTSIASIVVIVTLIFAYRQIREMAHSRSLSALSEIFKHLTSEDISVSRRYVLTHNLPTPGKASLEVYEHMHKVWVSFDNLGILVHFGILSGEIALAMFYDSAIKCWNKLEAHIVYERRVRKAWYQIYFQEFANLSRRYAHKLARQKYSEFRMATTMRKLGKARVLGQEIQGMYEKSGITKDSEEIQNRLSRLRQTIFLDRDGTLNVDCYVTYRDEQFELLDGVREGLQLLRTWGFELVIVTNQSGIGRGDYRLEDMIHFNELIIKELNDIELSQDDFYFCPHDPAKESCDCCKPNPGMLLKAAEERSINLKHSYLIGDKMSDILAGQRAGCKKTILVKTGITDDRDKYKVKPNYIVENLLEAAHIIANVEGIE